MLVCILITRKRKRKREGDIDLGARVPKMISGEVGAGFLLRNSFDLSHIIISEIV